MEKNRTSFPILAAIERLSIPAYILDPNDGSVRWLSSSAKALLGEPRGRHYRDLSAESSHGEWDDAFQAKVNGKSPVTNFNITLKAQDGRSIPVRASSTVVDLGGAPVIFGQFYPKSGETVDGRETKRLLTDRQLEILRLIAEGESTREIAGELHLSEATVKTHVRRILGVLNVSSRAAAVALAYQQGLF